MITITLCMIVKNEEDTLGRCLQSVREVVDEIIMLIRDRQVGPRKSPEGRPHTSSTLNRLIIMQQQPFRYAMAY